MAVSDTEIINKASGADNISAPDAFLVRVVIVTGMSGAGKSVALKSFEDMGFEAMDNIPLSLLSEVITPRKPTDPALAIGVDVRNRDFSVNQCEQTIDALRQLPGVLIRVLFLDCEDEILRRRYTETRRKHPLSDGHSVMEGLRHERDIMMPLLDYADSVLDTSDFIGADLKNWLFRHYSIRPTQALFVGVSSFSFRHGLPREADLVFDVRFLRNPHYVELLRPLTGKQPPVAAYIEEDPRFTPFFNHLTQLIMPLLPSYLEEGKSYLTIAIGCTGGKHRSVFVAEKLAKVLEAAGYQIELHHLQLEALK